LPGPVHILGLSAYYHDSAACLVRDGEVLAAAQEERFTRKKHDDSVPENAINYCLREAGLARTELDYVVFYDKPLLKFERLLSTYLDYAPSGFRSFIKAMPVWLGKKLWIRDEIAALFGGEVPVLFTEHHESHAASAFFPSPFESAAVLTIDGVGEWTTSSWGRGEGNTLDLIGELHFPHSLGLLYSAFTYYTGFKVNSGEYKVMGLAPYGEPRFAQTILDNLIDLRDDGSFRLNMDYFNYCQGLTMVNDKFARLFGGPPRQPESPLTQREMDLARSVQEVTETCMLRMVKHAHEQTGEKNLCLAGGVALNCVGNGRVLREGPFERIWIQPAAGDAGGALGAALSVWHHYLEQPRQPSSADRMSGSYLGPNFPTDEIRDWLVAERIPFRELDDADLVREAAALLADSKVVGWFQGRMEFGPRALGGRSILGDPRSAKTQSIMNLKIKYRESFRPFAPSVLAEHAPDFFEIDSESPYMLLVAPVTDSIRREMSEEEQNLFGIEKLNVPRSTIPAVTHVDYSARVQTVSSSTNPLYHGLITEFHRLTQIPLLVNTSFNVRGEPIVCTPRDAYRCFMRTEMDHLALGNFLLDKTAQPEWTEGDAWKEEFELD
jgi:carbamoyltransferase